MDRSGVGVEKSGGTMAGHGSAACRDVNFQAGRAGASAMFVTDMVASVRYLSTMAMHAVAKRDWRDGKDKNEQGQ
jgi:hypothetical protein